MDTLSVRVRSPEQVMLDDANLEHVGELLVILLGEPYLEQEVQVQMQEQEVQLQMQEQGLMIQSQDFQQYLHAHQNCYFQSGIFCSTYTVHAISQHVFSTVIDHWSLLSPRRSTITAGTQSGSGLRFLAITL